MKLQKSLDKNYIFTILLNFWIETRWKNEFFWVVQNRKIFKNNKTIFKNLLQFFTDQSSTKN